MTAVQEEQAKGSPDISVAYFPGNIGHFTSLVTNYFFFRFSFVLFFIAMSTYPLLQVAAAGEGSEVKLS